MQSSPGPCSTGPHGPVVKEKENQTELDTADSKREPRTHPHLDRLAALAVCAYWLENLDLLRQVHEHPRPARSSDGLREAQRSEGRRESLFAYPLSA